jgi:hypothetical protein
MSLLALVQQKIQEGLQLLESHQTPDSFFRSVSSVDQSFKTGVRERSTTFYAACSSLALKKLLHRSEISGLKTNLQKFLIHQKSEVGSFNYWVRGSLDAQKEPYPDDLDDTFLGLAALWHLDKSLIDGACFAQVVKLLTHNEKQEGGPYYTWLVEEPQRGRWKDVDLAVNCNIAYFLSLVGVTLPNLNAYIEKHVLEKNYFSQYYVSYVPVFYFIARVYKGTMLRTARDYFVAHLDQEGKWGNPLHTALIVSSVLNLELNPEKLAKSINYLITTPWSVLTHPYPFVTERLEGMGAIVSGCSAFMISSVLEALDLYVTATTSFRTIKIDHKAPAVASHAQVYTAIVSAITARCSKVDPDLKKLALTTLKHLLEKDAQQHIGLVAFDVRKSLKTNSPYQKKQLPIWLGAASMYGWMAYTLYDHFFDDEGDKRFLSVANLCLRELTSIYERILYSHAGLLNYFHQTMDILDNANVWEVTYCRARVIDGVLTIQNIPTYKNLAKLAERSMGHALGPLTILYFEGYKIDSSEYKNLWLFFYHYIIARQLNDDLHDWEEDLHKGHITSTVSEVLKRWVQKNKPSQLGINLQKYSVELQEIFWYEGVERGSKLIREHIQAARQNLEQLTEVFRLEYFLSLLQPFEQAALKVEHEQKEMIKFLNTYSSSYLKRA